MLSNTKCVVCGKTSIFDNKYDEDGTHEGRFIVHASAFVEINQTGPIEFDEQVIVEDFGKDDISFICESCESELPSFKKMIHELREKNARLLNSISCSSCFWFEYKHVYGYHACKFGFIDKNPSNCEKFEPLETSPLETIENTSRNEQK